MKVKLKKKILHRNVGNHTIKISFNIIVGQRHYYTSTCMIQSFD